MGRASAVHYAAAIAVCAIAPSSPASAAKFDTGNELLAACTGDAADQMQCYSFLDGLTQGLLFMSLRDSAETPYCAPAEVTKGQAAEVVVKYLRDNPAKRHLNGAVLSIIALRQAFPCAQK